MLVIIVKGPRECPNPECRSPNVKELGHDLECPNRKCQGQFCSQCFEIIYDGDGHEIKCPHCKQVLKLPGI